MSANFRPPRLALALLLLAGAWTPAAAQSRDDALAWSERVLLDPRADERAFYRAAQDLAGRPGGHTALIKGADYYTREHNPDRLATCLRTLAVAAGDRGDLVPDRLVPAYVRLLETARTPYPPVIRLMGRLGRRGRPALPVLRSIRDGADSRLTLVAGQAIREIESSKEK